MSFFKKMADIYIGKKNNSVPLYVTNEGGLFAKAEEVIGSNIVKAQLIEFAKLRIHAAEDSSEAEN